jgi:hypothetical protein
MFTAYFLSLNNTRNKLNGAEPFPSSGSYVTSTLWTVRCSVHNSSPLNPVQSQFNPVHTLKYYSQRPHPRTNVRLHSCFVFWKFQVSVLAHRTDILTDCLWLFLFPQEKLWNCALTFWSSFNIIKGFGPYLEENTTLHHYKDQLINAVQGNNLCLHWKSYRTHTYKMQNYWLLNRLVFIATVRL